MGQTPSSDLFSLWRDDLKTSTGDEPLKQLCFSIDVERDYRSDGRFATRGIEDGMPGFLDFLASKRIPFDLFVSGEVADTLPRNLLQGFGQLAALGCHGLSHVPGIPGYLNRRSFNAQKDEIESATKRIGARLGQKPRCFRAPNFSANEQTLLALGDLGYDTDSSVLPGRLVRKFKVWTLLDQRGAPLAPYHPDEHDLVCPGSMPILEVPVTPSLKEPGSPLGLGFLNDFGPEVAAREVLRSQAPYVVFLCHSWEMVEWNTTPTVVPWVRRASSADIGRVARFVEVLGDTTFLNMHEIHARQSRLIGDPDS